MRQRSAGRVASVAAGILLLAFAPLLAGCAGTKTSVHPRPAAAQTSPSAPAPSITPTFPDAPAFPVASPGATVDAASQHKAESWVADAAVPPGAVKSSTQPDGVASGAAPEMWCAPMADAVGYWTLPSMSADATLAWLTSHASGGMMVASASGNPRVGNETNVGGTVVDEPAPSSLEALIFTVTPIGSGAGIRADAFTKAAGSVCATPPPGTMLGIGG